jgi:hypothetical protein
VTLARLFTPSSWSIFPGTVQKCVSRYRGDHLQKSFSCWANPCWQAACRVSQCAVYEPEIVPVNVARELVRVKVPLTLPKPGVPLGDRATVTEPEVSA